MTQDREGYGGYAFHPAYATKFLVPGLMVKSNLDSVYSFFSEKTYLADATPSTLQVSWQPDLVSMEDCYVYENQKKPNYPFNIGEWVFFEKTHATPIEFLVSQRGVIKSPEDLNTASALSDVVRHL